MAKEDGGPVYPQQEFCPSGMPQTAMWPGISHRAYMATEAMKAILTANPSLHYDLVASEACDYADALLEALNK